MTDETSGDGLRIAVLVKQVPDVAQVTVDAETRLGILGPDRVLNTYDAYALSAALDVRDRVGGSVTAVALGPDPVRDGVVRALATGADEGLLISRPTLDDLDSLGTAEILAAALRDLAFDLVVTGQTSDDTETGQVGGQLAELLGWPHVSFVTSIDRVGDRVHVDRDAEGASERLATTRPAVLLVLSGRDGTQRRPSLRGMMQAKRKRVTVVNAVDIKRPSRLRWTAPRAPERAMDGTVIAGVVADEAADQLVAWLETRKLLS